MRCCVSSERSRSAQSDWGVTTIGHGGSGTDRVKCPGPQQQVDGRLDWNSIDDDDTGWCAGGCWVDW